MFAKILQWLREVWGKMVNTSDVKKTLNVNVVTSPAMMAALQEWTLMYENKSPWLTTDIKSLGLAAAISSEIARSVTLEMSVEIKGSPRADFLSLQMQDVVSKLRRQVEYGVAKGGLMMKPFVSGRTISVDFVQADQFYPVAFDVSGRITACVFSDQRTIGDKFYTRLEYHSMLPDGGGCQIVNRVFTSTSKESLGFAAPFDVVDAWADLEPEATITGIDRPLFAYFKYPLSNSIDTTSPLGVSCFSRAVDLIRQADQQWSDLLWEFESGRRALYVDELSFGRGTDGKPMLPNRRLYRTMSQSGIIGKDEDLFREWSPTYRELNILNGLEAILRKIEFSSGLAYGVISNPQTVDKTATEIKISNQRSYATVSATQTALQNALDDLVAAMDVWATLANLAPAGTYEGIYEFDDSIIVDREAQFERDLRLLGSNVISRVEFRMRNFGESEKAALAMLAKMEVTDPAGAFNLG